MREKSNISTALCGVLQRLGLTQEQLAKESAISQAAISKILGGNRRPNAKTMHALCRVLSAQDYADAVTVLIGHLKDEVEASGMLPSDVEIHPARQRAPVRIDIERDIDIVRTAAQQCPEAAALLKDLAWLIAHANLESAEDASIPMVAEVGPVYRTNADATDG